MNKIKYLLTVIAVCFYSNAFSKVFDAEEFYLDNNLRVVVVENHKAPIVKMMLWYQVGSMDEKAGKSGLAHLLEHLMFRGTSKVPASSFNEMMLEKRDELIKNGQFDDKTFDYARRFANADMIIIAAPFWDFSFPALLKIFIEHVCVSGIAFKYTNTGIQTLCKASKLYYVTTMGGYNSTDYGFGYIKALCNVLYGIDDVRLIKAEGLDIIGNDVDEIMEKVKKEIDKMVG